MQNTPPGNGYLATPSISSKPPSYREVADPSGEQQAPRKEHAYELSNKKGDKWLTLTVLGDVQESKQGPAILQGQDITGSVVFSNAEAVRSITISATGHIITGATPSDDFVFIERGQTIWPKEDVEPGASAETEITSPFSLSLPAQVLLPGAPGQGDQLSDLPMSFFERHTRASISYELVLKVVYHKFLKHDKKLQVPLTYVPITKPKSPSPLRQFAYRHKKPVPTPKTDPDGWQTLPPVTLRGKAFGNRSLEVTYTLSLALPLCYTRGTVLVCAVTVECEDSEAIKRLGSPKGVILRLRRSVQYHASANGSEDPKHPDDITYSESAVLWPSDDAQGFVSKRSLVGELHLRGDLQPSSAMAHFAIRYALVLFGCDDPAFEWSVTEPTVLTPVQIATTHADGAAVIAYSKSAF